MKALLLNNRAIRYVYLRTMKHSGSPEYVARGVAIGFFIAFFIPVPFQMLTALPVALGLRAARFIALLSTWISNPLTIAFLYPLQCYVGSYLIQRPLSYAAVKELLGSIINEPSWNSFIMLGKEILTAFLVGGFLFGTIAAILGYHSAIHFIIRHRKKKAARQQLLAARRL